MEWGWGDFLTIGPCPLPHTDWDIRLGTSFPEDQTAPHPLPLANLAMGLSGSCLAGKTALHPAPHADEGVGLESICPGCGTASPSPACSGLTPPPLLTMPSPSPGLAPGRAWSSSWLMQGGRAGKEQPYTELLPVGANCSQWAHV